MIKTRALTIVAAAAFAATSVFAGGKACCTSSQSKMECSQIYAKLNLTPAQKSKLDMTQLGEAMARRKQELSSAS